MYKFKAVTPQSEDIFLYTEAKNMKHAFKRRKEQTEFEESIN